MEKLVPLFVQLREGTRAAHRVLDHHPLLAPLVRPGVSIQQYGDVLLALHGVHAPLEDRVLAFLERHPGLFDYSGRSKRGAIESDIAALGRRPCSLQLQLDGFDAFDECHELRGIGELVGTLYPLEGSMLGGQVIARQLRASGLGELPLRFMTCYGDQVDARWAQFMAWAEAVCPPTQYPVAVDVAQRLFASIARHLDAVQAHLKR